MSILTQRAMGVYSITFHSKRGDMVYIGSTTQTFEQRKWEHLSELRRGKHCNKYMQRLWDKYQNFTFEIVEVCDDPHAVAIREQWYIEHTDKSKLINNGPARPSPRFGVPVSEEARRKMSQAAKARCARPEERERLRLQATGRSPSAETRRKLSEASKKFYGTPNGRAFLSKINKGKTVSDATREKLREANRGRKPSERCIAALRKAVTGRKPTPDETEKRSASLKRFYRKHPEKRAEISASLSKRIISDETREKLRTASTGKRHSQETKEKLRQIALDYYARKKVGEDVD